MVVMYSCTSTTAELLLDSGLVSGARAKSLAEPQPQLSPSPKKSAKLPVLSPGVSTVVGSKTMVEPPRAAFPVARTVGSSGAGESSLAPLRVPAGTSQLSTAQATATSAMSSVPSSSARHVRIAHDATDALKDDVASHGKRLNPQRVMEKRQQRVALEHLHESPSVAVGGADPRADPSAALGAVKLSPYSMVYTLNPSLLPQTPHLTPEELRELRAADIYGNSPGMEALGDIKQLQHEQLRKGQAIDYQTKPPLLMPASMKNRDIDTLPGGISFVTDPNAVIRSAFDVNLNLQHLLGDIQDTRERIRGSFYADLFLMLHNATDTRMTATEVAERHEEKLLMLGPVIERLHNELLEPLVDITFTHMVSAGIIPPAPPEMQGMDLSIEFVSMLAQAQRAIGTNSIDRLIGNIGAIAQFKPDVHDKFDSDQWCDVYSDMLGVDPSLIIADKNVAVIREARNKAQAAQAQAGAMQQQSQTAKNLAAAPTNQNDPNALTDMMNQFSGYNSPSAVEV